MQRDKPSMSGVVKTTIVHEKHEVRISLQQNHQANPFPEHIFPRELPPSSVSTAAELFWYSNFFLRYFSGVTQTFKFVRVNLLQP